PEREYGRMLEKPDLIARARPARFGEGLHRAPCRLVLDAPEPTQERLTYGRERVGQRQAHPGSKRSKSRSGSVAGSLTQSGVVALEGALGAIARAHERPRDA